MKTILCLFLTLFATTIDGFDLGPSMRIAQCRSLCLQRHREVKTCKETPDCYMCWETCGLLENDWTVWGSVCQDDEEICFSGCKTACAYRATRVEKQLLPAALPAPMLGPVNLGRNDVAVIFRKFEDDWVEMDQHTGEGTLTLNRTTWIVVVSKNGARQYSGEYWKPRLETLKEGALFEATLSWISFDELDNEIPDGKEGQHRDRVVSDLNSAMTLDFENEEMLKNALEMAEGRVGESSLDKVVGVDSTGLVEKIARASSSGYQSDGPESNERDGSRYLESDSTKYFEEHHKGILSDVVAKDDREHLLPESFEDDLEDAASGSADRAEIYKEEPTLIVTTSKNSVDEESNDERKRSYVVSWEPEAGGLMGNQITDARSTQISLLPGTKYLVRVASNDGPGSFALEIDTTTKSVRYAPLEAVAVNVQPWAILAGCASALPFVALVMVVKLYLTRGPKDDLDFV